MRRMRRPSGVKAESGCSLHSVFPVITSLFLSNFPFSARTDGDLSDGESVATVAWRVGGVVVVVEKQLRRADERSGHFLVSIAGSSEERMLLFKHAVDCTVYLFKDDTAVAEAQDDFSAQHHLS